MLKKIVIIGPESTGKSTLSALLAEHFQTLWVPEFAREYLLLNGKEYTYDDLLTIARGQLALEDKFVKKLENQSQPHFDNGGTIPLFIDTDMYVMKVWSEFVFGNCHRFILDNIVARKYDLYLLCNVDLPWVQDELREYPDLVTRQKLYYIYKDIMVNQSIPWIDISGSYEDRLQIAIEAVNKLIGTH